MKKWDTDLLYHNYYYLTAALVKEQLTVQDNTTRVWENYVLLFTNDSNSALLGAIMNNKQSEQWEKTRSKGKMRFIFVRNVLGWGLPVGVIYSIWTYRNEGIMAIVQSTITFLICGLIFGAIYWMVMENKYKGN